MAAELPLLNSHRKCPAVIITDSLHPKDADAASFLLALIEWKKGISTTNVDMRLRKASAISLLIPPSLPPFLPSFLLPSTYAPNSGLSE